MMTMQDSLCTPTKASKGIIVNDTNDALNWANEQYNHIREDAKPILYRGSTRRNARLS